MMHRVHQLSRFLCAPLLVLTSLPLSADWQMNMGEGVTEVSRQVYGLHMIALYICIAIGVVVFGAMFYSIIKHRKSKGAKAANFHEHVGVEIVWTIIPFIILIALAYPAAILLIKMHDGSNADVTIKITGHQWKWEYEYLDNDMHFFSQLSEQSRRASLRNADIRPQDVENYLMDVDNPLVIPVNKKVRFLITASDVLHSWWMPAFAVKRDAIPGFINEAWAKPDAIGTYRGQCAELCGRGHAYMPIVVKVVSEQDYANWLQANGVQVASADTPAQAGGLIASANAQQASTEQTAQGEPTADTQAQPAISENDAQQDSDQSQGASTEVDMSALMQRGQEVYSTRCVACHQPSGDGISGAFPALKGEAFLAKSLEQTLDAVMNGASGTAMVAFANQLNDNDIAAVTTYIRNEWGNQTGEFVTPDQVKSKR